MELHRLLISSVIFCPLFLFSQVEQAIEQRFSPLPELVENAWENPALVQFKYDQSLTSLTGSFRYSNSERYGEFSAETFTHLNNQVTIAGRAFYDKGANHNIIIGENADIPKVYPYLVYDDAGGKQDLERYSFGGEVAVKLTNHWRIGAYLSYNAGLYYRNVDPRPKNTTGDFNIGIGGSYSITDNYAVGIKGSFNKYKQSSDIIFKSEQGASKIFHLTGLATHYNRFAGSAGSTYYTGKAFDIALTLIPTDAGLYLNATFRKDNLRVILEDFNNLPMARIDSRNFGVHAGYKSRRWSLVASADLSRRHGYENIFGDAASGHYPQIGSLAMHLVNLSNYYVKGSATMNFRKLTLYINPEIEYIHYREVYREPRSVISFDRLAPSLECKAIASVANKFLILGTIGYTWNIPLAHSFENITITDPNLQPYLDAMTQEFGDATSFSGIIQASAGIDWLICSRRYTIGLEAAYRADKLQGNHSVLSASFRF